ncbi:MAG TPA: AAA family ATPase [Pseudonocardiaceae bacterium]|nr:AAA family ATPase [Pseudonocardiaceae bacterium]
MGQVWPLTGGVEELQLIQAAMPRRAEGSRGVVLAGAAGVGKTRLAREALALAKSRGAMIRWATGTASAHELPLGAFASLLGRLEGDPAQVLAQASKALLAGGDGGEVVLGVDDAHLLDETSALLVHQPVLDRAVTLVITVRTRERTPDAVTVLWKDGHLERLEVGPLSEPETAALLEAVPGRQMDSVSAAGMWVLANGNALFLRQLVDGELESDHLRLVDGVWRWSGTPAVSAELIELVDTRMGQLSDPVGQIVDVLAFGEPLGVSVLTALTDAASVEQAELRGLVSVERDGRRLHTRLAHPLYGEVRRARAGQYGPGGYGAVSPKPSATPAPAARMTPCAVRYSRWIPNSRRIRTCSLPRPGTLPGYLISRSPPG